MIPLELSIADNCEAREDEESEDERPQNTQRKRQARRSDDSDEEEEEDEEGDTAMGGDADGDSQEQLVKKLVRYALACEYQRIPIRRAGISEKGEIGQDSCF